MDLLPNCIRDVVWRLCGRGPGPGCRALCTINPPSARTRLTPGGAPRPGCCCAAGAHRQPHPHPQKFRGHRVSHVVTRWSHTGHVVTCVAHWALLSCQRPGCTAAQFAPPWQISGSSAATLYETSRQPIILVQVFTLAMTGEDSKLCWF